MPALAVSQTPDVAIFSDLRPTWSVENTNKSRFQWYDLQGRYSLIGFRLILEPGYRVSVSQRLQRIDNSGDPDSLDEYYIEDRGNWRIGKQYLPFGTRNMLRETALAARIDTRLVFDEVPIQIAYADAGPGRIRGVVARIGNSLGISAAVGNHFGIQSTALTQVQLPLDAPGRGRGYRLALGADATWDLKEAIIVAEWVMLKDGETSLDLDRNVSDIKFIWSIPHSSGRITTGWSRTWDLQKDFFHVEGEVPFNDKVTWIPFVRFDNQRLKDFGVSARIKF